MKTNQSPSNGLCTVHGLDLFFLISFPTTLSCLLYSIHILLLTDPKTHEACFCFRNFALQGLSPAHSSLRSIMLTIVLPIVLPSASTYMSLYERKSFLINCIKGQTCLLLLLYPNSSHPPPFLFLLCT